MQILSLSQGRGRQRETQSAGRGYDQRFSKNVSWFKQRSAGKRYKRTGHALGVAHENFLSSVAS